MRFQPEWFPAFAFYFALMNAALVAVAGTALGLATMYEVKDELEKLRVQTVRVVGTIVVANAAAAILLGALRWVLS